MAKDNNYDDLQVCELTNGKVMAVMDKETWKTIVKVIRWANNRMHKDRGDYVPDIHESDEWNYGYTRRGF